MNNIQQKIEKSRQEYLREEKRNQEKKTDVFSDFIGFITMIAGIVAVYHIFKGWLF